MVSILNASDKEWTKKNFRKAFPRSKDFKVRNFEYPKDPDAVVVTGSKNSVYEDKAWINKLLDKIKDYASSGTPMLGVCFGHQAIAEALGGKVEKMDQREIGYREVEHDHPHLFKGLRRNLKPFVSHHNRVVKLPENMEQVAETEKHIYGLKHGEKPVYSVQFHPEYDRETAEEVIKSKNLEREREKDLLTQVTKNRHREALESRIVLRNFQRITKKT